MKNFIKSLKLRKSDLFLLLGFLPLTIFFIFGQLFMQFQNPNDVALPLWAAIVCLVIMVGSWAYYLYLEVYLKKDKFNLYIPAVFLFLLLLNVITILVQKDLHTTNIVRYGDITGSVLPVNVQVSTTHKLIFISEFIGTISFIYIGLFVFPRRISSLVFIKYLGYALFAFLLVLIVYGYIAEFDKYVSFFKYILNIDRSGDIYHMTVISFIIHRNAYGMAMMLGIIFAFINHSIEKKWYYYLFAIFFFINMIFSLCKTGLIISILIILTYVIYRLVVTFKDNKKRNTIILASIIGVAAIAIGVVGLSYVTKGKVFGSIYGMINDLFRGGESVDFRGYIWDNTYQLIDDGNWLIGRGFGVINLMLEPMNIASHGEKVFPTHSAYLGLLAEGGILFLLAYLILLGYSAYIIYKCFKKNPGLTLTMSLGVLAFVLYSLIETIHYLVYVFLFPIMVLYYTSYQKEETVK